MAQTCTVCRHPQRLALEKELISGTPVREIAGRFGTSKTAVSRHRQHIASTIAEVAQVRDQVRVGSLLQDVRAGEGRADRLYVQAEQILTAALNDNDRGGALQAVKTAATVLAQARSYLELRGQLTQELGRDRSLPAFSIQILCPASAPSLEQLPRISFVSEDQIEVDPSWDIGVLQGQ